MLLGINGKVYELKILVYLWVFVCLYVWVYVCVRAVKLPIMSPDRQFVATCGRKTAT
jgi:hypothetical protein